MNSRKAMPDDPRTDDSLDSGVIDADVSLSFGDSLDSPQTLADGAAEDSLKSGFEARYELLEKLGEGGMGQVFKARDRRLGRSS